MCDGHALRVVLDASRAVWLFQTSGEQQRNACKALPSLRVATQKRVCGVARLANGRTIGCAPRLASIAFVTQRIFRFLLK